MRPSWTAITNTGIGAVVAGEVVEVWELVEVRLVGHVGAGAVGDEDAIVYPGSNGVAANDMLSSADLR